MFLMFISLTGGTAGIEIFLGRCFPRFANWMEAKKWHSFLFSMGLSFGLSLLFPAEGLIVMTAGICSTLLTQPYWGVRRALEQRRVAKALAREEHRTLSQRAGGVVVNCRSGIVATAKLSKRQARKAGRTIERGVNSGSEILQDRLAS